MLKLVDLGEQGIGPRGRSAQATNGNEQQEHKQERTSKNKQAHARTNQNKQKQARTNKDKQ